jgi:bifunctional non-homologous end joining protein LigD
MASGDSIIRSEGRSTSRAAAARWVRGRHPRETLSSMPTHVAPMLAVLSDMPSDPAGYNFEYKWDGVRAIALYDGSKLRLHSRNGLDITARYPELGPLAAALGRGRRIVLDGEIVAIDDAGRPSFPLLQRRMHVNDRGAIQRLSRDLPVLYVLFDVPFLDGRWIARRPYDDRRELLQSLTLQGPHWQVTPAHVGEGPAMLDAARRHGMEGLIAKRLDSLYEPGVRSRSWRKIKLTHRQEFVIGGWLAQQNDPARVGALLVGYHDCDAPAALHYAGSVGSGFTDVEQQRLRSILEPLRVSDNPFVEPVPRPGANYLRPTLVAEVEYRRWPAGGMIQQASYKGLRPDKRASDVVKEQAATDRPPPRR